MPKPRIIIYHKADFDGIFCCNIAKKALGGFGTYIGWDYGDLVPDVPSGVELFMLDISIDSLMGYPGLVWIDHHKTAIEKFSDGIKGLRLDGVAACRLAWQWFFETGDRVHDTEQIIRIKDFYIERNLIEPLAVRLAGEYDVWDKRDVNAELFQHGLRSQDLDGLWPKLLRCDWEGDSLVASLLQQGKAVQYAQDHTNESIIKSSGFTLDFEGKRFLALNAARYNSLAFTAGLMPEHDGCLGFKWVGNKWSVSMYGVPGKPDEDFTPIASKHGGGGHKQACGFTANELPFKLGG